MAVRNVSHAGKIIMNIKMVVYKVVQMDLHLMTSQWAAKNVQSTAQHVMVCSQIIVFNAQTQP